MDTQVISYERLTTEHEHHSIQLTWQDITFKVKSAIAPDAQGFTELIHGVAGVAEPGQVLAIMGSSGAGKTTLLNILSDRLTKPKNTKVTGCVFANGQAITSIDYKSYVGYVMQDDILLDTMTPRECLLFSANLRLRGTPESKKSRVEGLLNELKLSKVAENRIGSVMRRGLSGGERRRVSIAVELIVDPSVIFLDGNAHPEPTSGLDSTNALNVMNMLTDLAKRGITVVATIHQPSIEIFAQFDKLILMAEGHNVYQGTPRESLPHFKGLGYEPPPLISEPDFYMKILHVANRDAKTADEETRLQLFTSNYSREHETSKDETSLQALSTNEFINKPGFVHEFKCLFSRAFRNMLRNMVTTRMKVVQTFTYAILIVMIYNGMGDGAKGVQDRGGVLFFCQICMVQGAILSVILGFPVERALFLKEQSQSLYSVLPYFLGKMLSELPMYIFTPTVFGTIVYFGIGLNTSEISKFFIFSKDHSVLVMFLLHGIGESLGLMVGALISQISIAPNIGMICVVPFMMVGGFFSSTQSIPVAFRWFSYLSVSPTQPYRYAFESLCRNEFTNLHLSCAKCEAPCVPCDPLKSFDFQEDMWEAIYILVGYLVASRVLAFFVLKSRVQKLGS